MGVAVYHGTSLLPTVGKALVLILVQHMNPVRGSNVRERVAGLRLGRG